MMRLSDQDIARNLKHSKGEPGKRIADSMKDSNSYMYDHLLSHFDLIKAADQIIEIGCADGSNSRKIIDNISGNYKGIDQSEDMIALARSSFERHPKLGHHREFGQYFEIIFLKHLSVAMFVLIGQR